MSIEKASVLITGATGGLGRRTALALAKQGHNLIVHGRRPDAVEELRASLTKKTDIRAEGFVADLSRLTELRQALGRLQNKPLGGIVANAGLASDEDLRNAEGYELIFAVNVLAHQLIICTLVDQLVAGSRVVIVSSGVHHPDNTLARRAGIPLPRWVGTRQLARPDEAEPAARLENGQERYSTSKLGNVLQARGLQAKLREQQREIDVFAIDPGLMVDTDFMRNQPAPKRVLMRVVGGILTPFVSNMRRSKVTARHITSLIESPEWQGRGFAYLDGDQVHPTSPDALDDARVEEFWRESSVLLGIAQ